MQDEHWAASRGPVQVIIHIIEGTCRSYAANARLLAALDQIHEILSTQAWARHLQSV